MFVATGTDRPTQQRPRVSNMNVVLCCLNCTCVCVCVKERERVNKGGGEENKGCVPFLGLIMSIFTFLSVAPLSCWMQTFSKLFVV